MDIATSKLWSRCRLSTLLIVIIITTCFAIYLMMVLYPASSLCVRCIDTSKKPSAPLAQRQRQQETQKDVRVINKHMVGIIADAIQAS